MVRVEVVDNLAEPVGELWKDRQRSRIEECGSFNLAAPLSSTPLPIYQWVVRHADEFVSWPSVEFVLMDEQLDADRGEIEYVSLDDEASYERFARIHLQGPLHQATGCAIPLAKPTIGNLSSFDTSIDLLILALGVEGNYANVMPGTSFESGWHVASLLPSFRNAHTDANSLSYAGASFREKGMSLGPQQVIEAREVVVVISGAKKRELAKRLLALETFDTQFPLSIIHHPEVAPKTTVFITSDALATDDPAGVSRFESG